MEPYFLISADFVSPINDAFKTISGSSTSSASAPSPAVRRPSGCEATPTAAKANSGDARPELCNDRLTAGESDFRMKYDGAAVADVGIWKDSYSLVAVGGLRFFGLNVL